MTSDDVPGHGAASRRSNAFDLLRLTAALAVIGEHSWVLTGNGTPLPATTGTGLGRIGVGVFFLISGYLIARSWGADPSLRRFALRRALRIYPAYAVVVVLTVFALGPALTSLSTGEYFGSAGTWSHLVRNLLIVPVQYDLPGVFETVPEPGAVNGSLWTIRVEVFCYAAVAVLGVAGVLRRRLALGLLAVAAVGFAAVLAAIGYDGALIPGALAATAAEPLAYFAIGMVVAAAGPPGRRTWPLAALATAGWVASWGTPVAGVAAVPAISALTIAVAFRSPVVLHHPTGGLDLSYGTYLMAFPVQQWLAHLGLRSPLAMALATVAVVVPLALASWVLIERPALARKPRRPARDAVGTGAGGQGGPMGEPSSYRFPRHTATPPAAG